MRVFNRTHFEHAGYALAIQLALFPLVSLVVPLQLTLWITGALGIMFLIGREYAQAEYKARIRLGRSLTAMQPWHLLSREYWSLDALLDVVVPIGFVVALAAATGMVMANFA